MFIGKATETNTDTRQNPPGRGGGSGRQRGTSPRSSQALTHNQNLAFSAKGLGQDDATNTLGQE